MFDNEGEVEGKRDAKPTAARRKDAGDGPCAGSSSGVNINGGNGGSAGSGNININGGGGGAMPLRPVPSRQVLIVLHQAHSTPGHIGHWLTGNGYRLDIRRPALADDLPQSLQEHAGVIIFGGPMSANDNDEFLIRERRLIEIALKERKACLGVCLGGQLMAQVLGSRVYGDGRGRVEIGYFAIEPTPAGREICDWPAAMYQWHREGFDLPTGARLLALSDGIFPNQAYVYGGNAVGIQFHPEITLAMIYRWTTRAAERLALPGAKPRLAHISDHIGFQPQVDRWRNDFLGKLLSTGFHGDRACDMMPAEKTESLGPLPIS